MAIATTAQKNTLATAYGTAATYAALFTADPGGTGTVVGEVTGGSPAYARKAVTWGAPSAGVITASVTFDVPTGTTITFAAVCSAATGNTLLDKAAVTSQAFASAGQYVLTLTFTES
jgi:hypothetical protein